MGGGGYSSYSRSIREEERGYKSKSTHEIFTQRSINNAMNPCGITLRESCDSAEHPESLAIIIALDVTGSMGSVPHFLVKEGLPKIMTSIIQAGIAHPQVLFLAIGDHEYDSSPLQVGQFESSDELLDKWLTDVFLEGGGGSNYGESYSLAHFFAGNYTSIDCFKNRGQKGILFTIGDEPTLRDYPASSLKKIMGDGQYSSMSSAALLEQAQKTWDCYHIHVKSTGAGGRQTTIDGWKQLMGDNCIIAERREDVASAISQTIVSAVKPTNTQTQSQTQGVKINQEVTPIDPEMNLL